MKKLIGMASAGMMALALLGAPATAAAAVQHVEGTIALPAPFAQGTFAGCWGGGTRRATTPTGGAASPANGSVGYRFEIDKSTWNKPFKLEVTGGEGTVDLDIFMYLVMPPAEDTVDDPVNGGSPVSVDYGNRKEGGEAGIVPKGATEAIVCMYAGPEYFGFNSSFMYMAGKGVK
jgi:hypothetical protein